MVNFILMIGINHKDSGGNLGGRGSTTNFRKFLPKRGLKTASSSANGGVCRKF